MSTVVVSHGMHAAGDSVWFPYLRDALSGDGHRVETPDLPASATPRPEPWLTTYGAAVGGTDPADTVLVGHSIGGVNVLRLLEAHDPDRDGRFAGAVLVATPARDVGYEVLEEFFAEPFDWPRIRRAATSIRVLTAVDDPVMAPDPIEHVRTFVTELGATAVLKADGAHFGATPDDHIELPEVVHLIRDCLTGPR
jgi:predicted alpha/beta hydrolase family esterase